MAGVVEAVRLDPLVSEFHIKIGSLGLGFGGHKVYSSLVSSVIRVPVPVINEVTAKAFIHDLA